MLRAPVVAPLPATDPDVIAPVSAAAQEVVVLAGANDEPPALVIIPGIGRGGVSPTAAGIGLTPPLSSSVEPSGIAPPSSLNWEPVTAVVSGEAVPFEEGGCNEAQPATEIADPFAAIPPPSKIEAAPVIVPVVPEALIAYPPEPDARMPQFGFGAGLKPPGLISVAPNGMPVPLDPPEPSMPRGEVAPIADGLIELCAWLEPQLIATASIAAVITRNRRIADSVACFA